MAAPLWMIAAVAAASDWTGAYVERSPAEALALEIGVQGEDGWYAGKLTYRGNLLPRGTFPVHATTCPKRPDCGRDDRLYVFGDPKDAWGAMTSTRPLFSLDRSSGTLVTRRAQHAPLQMQRVYEPPSAPVAVPVEALAERAVVLTEPWTEMALPIGAGTVVQADDITVTITYADEVAQGHFDQYRAALVAEGWAVTLSSAGGMLVETYERDNEIVTLQVMTSLGTSAVMISRLVIGPASEPLKAIPPLE